MRLLALRKATGRATALLLSCFPVSVIWGPARMEFPAQACRPREDSQRWCGLRRTKGSKAWTRWQSSCPVCVLGNVGGWICGQFYLSFVMKELLFFCILNKNNYRVLNLKFLAWIHWNAIIAWSVSAKSLWAHTLPLEIAGVPGVRCLLGQRGGVPMPTSVQRQLLL